MAMSNEGEVITKSFGGAREHPFSFSRKRRLRDLQGVSVRNLNVTPLSSRPRANTDEDVEYTSKSSVNLLAESEVRDLQQTRSFSNLTSRESNNKTAVHTRPSNKDGRGAQPSKAPIRRQIRRASTLHWTGANPEARQKKLQAVAHERLAQAWFSLHAPELAEPIYISELAEKSINPSFRTFDLKLSDPNVTRRDLVCLRLWVRTDRLRGFVLLIELDLCLGSLQYLAPSLEGFCRPLPANCILFHFEDGIYTSITELSSQGESLISRSEAPRRSATVKPSLTSSYNALTQLANIDDCIQDALATRKTLERQINALLSRHEDDLQHLAKKSEAEEALHAVDRATLTEQRHIRMLGGKRRDSLASLQLRRDAIKAGRTTQDKADLVTDWLEQATQQVERQSKQMLVDWKGQVRRICEDLMLVYPIESLKNRPLHFTIRNLFHPNSVFNDTNRDEIAAALGFTSNMVHVLSLYLSTPLPYPIMPASSMSTIEDPVSIGITQRTFPLYPTSTSYKFEYAVFLLNKNIEFLLNKNGLQILDIRHTLPNLKYMLCVLTAGTGEVPARKAGVIKGPVAGRMSPTLSRQGSQDSIHSSAGFDPALAHGILRHRSPPARLNGGEKPSPTVPDTPNHMAASPGGKSHVYRNTSLREEAF